MHTFPATPPSKAFLCVVAGASLHAKQLHQYNKNTRSPLAWINVRQGHSWRV